MRHKTSRPAVLSIIILLAATSPAYALFNKCHKDDYVRPKLEDIFYTNDDNESEEEKKLPKLSKLLKKLCLKKTDENILSKASWYGSKFQGRRTANAELYDKALFTAAHKTLPFGTYVLVSNLNNEKEVLVRINDRGPFISGRDLDLSEAAARELGILAQGVATIKYQSLKDKLPSDKDKDEEKPEESSKDPESNT